MKTTLTNANDNWIYQNNKLVEASHCFSVLEQKLVRMLASMIQKDDVEFKKYEFKANELSDILHIHPKSIYRELDKVTDKLMLRVIKIKNDEEQKFKKFHLIKTAEFENGILTMEIDVEMKEFYLQLKQYTKYQLKNIMQFKSAYSFRLYELLKQYERIGHRIINIEDLRVALDIETTCYPIYSNLKQRVINVTTKEINENTDIHIEYKEIKENRKVVKIQFFIKSKVKAISEVGIDKVDSEIKLIQEIFIKHHPIAVKEAKILLEDAKGNKSVKNPIDCIRECYSYALTINIKTSIVGYIRKMLQGFNLNQKNIAISSVGNFNDYEQRAYDFDELEKKLLGRVGNKEIPEKNSLSDMLVDMRSKI
ncbi:replication initiation protein [Clostridium estertheticum]|uniref:replication initiation protein n=1 Tax=Clostridium estertheticum TaxID=238834 RepID=UPI001C7CF928|nr:replication initiation protein [Clostridium estertheticum]MBX4267157.1 replication initiation protein [Clostridium estertheticum]MBX4272024.1 replication initiation protein [Clostridium estertheticum]WLC82409.1 replication initiation protein [Clostridium estertheticum]WLC91280.1 replication initiation protein [Clostridium estertheticum]